VEAAGDCQKPDVPLRQRQIGYAAPILDIGKPFRSMDTDQRFPTPGPHNDLITFEVRTLYSKPPRLQTGALGACCRRRFFFNQGARHPPNCIKSESMPIKAEQHPRP